MCTNCFSAVDAAIANSMVMTAAVTTTWTRLSDRLKRRPRIERQLAAWEKNAAYYRAMGLDPLETLGAPPAIPGPVEPSMLHDGDSSLGREPGVPRLIAAHQ